VVKATMRPGTSLVEALVSLVVLAAGLLAVSALVTRSLRLLDEAAAVDRATAAAVSILDSLTQHESPVAGSTIVPPDTIDWDVRPTGRTRRIELRVRFPDGARMNADTFTSVAAPLPRRLTHAP
jgi:hypothetical protein